MREQVRVGGLLCSEVLDRLVDFGAGSLAESDRRAVETHLAGCDRCAEFGDAYGLIVAAVRVRATAAPAPPGFATRVLARARREEERTG